MMDSSLADDLASRRWPAEREARPTPSSASPSASRAPAPQVPSQPRQQQALVETVENNSIVIEIGRIEVKAPPVAPPSAPAPSQRRAARLSLDAYLAGRRGAKR
jgi:hypothetical protein